MMANDSNNVGMPVAICAVLGIASLVISILYVAWRWFHK
jgi:hypothetical protein